jgi:hypothetical protein
VKYAINISGYSLDNFWFSDVSAHVFDCFVSSPSRDWSAAQHTYMLSSLYQLSDESPPYKSSAPSNEYFFTHCYAFL